MIAKNIKIYKYKQSDGIGNTPVAKFFTPKLKLPVWAKLEEKNLTGSMKDRFAKNVISTLIQNGSLRKGDAIVESSSGNFGIALAAQAKIYDLDFYCIIDPNICPANERILSCSSAKIIKVKKRDSNGGYLLTRIAEVNRISREKGAYWINQYSNELAPPSYSAIADELVRDLGKIDYIFIAVSTGGTVAGISKRMREVSPATKIIAVDVEGSLVFSDLSKKRHIPGMGSSFKSKQIKPGDVDGVVIVGERDIISACYKTHDKQKALIGGSSGAVLAAIDKYFHGRRDTSNLIAAVFPDNGVRYLDNIYNPKWINNHFKELNVVSK